MPVEVWDFGQDDYTATLWTLTGTRNSSSSTVTSLSYYITLHLHGTISLESVEHRRPIAKAVPSNSSHPPAPSPAHPTWAALSTEQYRAAPSCCHGDAISTLSWLLARASLRCLLVYKLAGSAPSVSEPCPLFYDFLHHVSLRNPGCHYPLHSYTAQPISAGRPPLAEPF